MEQTKELPDRVTAKGKDPLKVTAGRAGAAARKAKTERLFEERLRAAKESFHAADSMTDTRQTPSHADVIPPVKAVNWTTAALLIGAAGLVGLVVMFREKQQPVTKKQNPTNDVQLKDPFHMV